MREVKIRRLGQFCRRTIGWHSSERRSALEVEIETLPARERYCADRSATASRRERAYISKVSRASRIYLATLSEVKSPAHPGSVRSASKTASHALFSRITFQTGHDESPASSATLISS